MTSLASASLQKANTVRDREPRLTIDLSIKECHEKTAFGL